MRKYLVAAALAVTIWLPIVFGIAWLQDQRASSLVIAVGGGVATWLLLLLWNRLEFIGDESLIKTWLEDRRGRRERSQRTPGNDDDAPRGN